MEEPGWKQAKHLDDLDTACGELLSIRTQIDSLDSTITPLLAKRLELARQLAAVKGSLGRPVYDPDREAAVLQRVTTSAGFSRPEPALTGAIAAVYKALLAESRQIQAQAKSAAESPTGQKHTDSQSSKAPLYFPRVLIVGMGLMGGAVARQIKRCLPKTFITGSDQLQVLNLALSASVIDAAQGAPCKAVTKADLVVLAAGPQANLAILQQLAPHLRPGQLVIDLTSCKSEICTLADELNLSGADFIGGHPLFGSHKSGFEHSLEVAVDGKVFCLVPGKKSPEISMRRLSRWLSALNLKVAVCDATTHDAGLAQLSHLLQLLSVALGSQVAECRSAEELKYLLSLSGPSFVQLSRLMASPSQLWIEILLQNKSAVTNSLAAFIENLRLLHLALESGDTDYLMRAFANAGRISNLLAERT